MRLPIGFLIVSSLAVVAYLLAVAPLQAGPYPLHVDEWTHLAYADALVQAKTLPHSDPLYGQEGIGFRPELGFRVLLAEFHLATGIEWVRFFPMAQGGAFALFVLVCLSLGRRIGAGPLLGVMALGAPTTMRFLGPALLVPVAVGLIFFVAISSLLAEESSGAERSIPLLGALFLSATLFIHPPSAAVLAGLLTVLAIVRARAASGPARTAFIACAAIAVLLPVLWLFAVGASLRTELTEELVRDAATGEGLVTEYLRSAGFVRIAAFAMAVFALMLWRPRPAILVLVSVYAALLGYIRLHEAGLFPSPNFYDRSWLYLDLLLSVITALGLSTLSWRMRTVLLARRYRAFLLASYLGVMALGTAIVANTWTVRTHERFEPLASPETLADFRWIRGNLADMPGLTLINPEIALSYPVVAGRSVYAVGTQPRPSSDERIARAVALLTSTTPPDPAVLREEGISVVYGPHWHAEDTDAMVQVRPAIYIVSPDPARVVSLAARSTS